VVAQRRARYRTFMAAIRDRELLFFATAPEWESWLAANLTHDGIRLQLRKKATTKPGMLYPEALDVALCWGWIDGQSGSIDADYYFVSFQPRRPRSIWSDINRGHVTRLIADGRMKPEGQAEIDRAKADGRWDAAYRQKDAPVPEDLAAALAASPNALAFFDTLSAQNRFAVLFRVQSVKRAETRARKIEQFVQMCERGETIYPQKR
jgi:uncharacterized protein YdeI (YjbR/CyaY-like superfamily)